MGGKLPNASTATVDIRKLRDYVLNASHPEGRHKARVFLSALGLVADDSQWLAATILAGIGEAAAIETGSNAWGVLYQADMPIRRGERCAKIRTGWLCQGAATRLTTCFVIGDCDETA